MMNKSFRTNFLLIAKDEGFSTQGFSNLKMTEKTAFLKWLILRSIKVRTVVVEDCLTIFENDRKKLFSKVRCLKIGCMRSKINVASIQIGEFFARCALLEKLTICNCDLISNDVLFIIATVCKNLSEFRLQYCPSVSFIKNLPVGYTLFPKLKVFDVRNCRNLSNDFIGLVAVSCSRLVEVDLTLCSSVTDASIISDVAVESLAQHSKNLKALNLGGCKLVTDAAMMNLVESIPLLQILDVGGCSQLTDLILTAVENHCVDIRELNLCNCRKFTFHCIQRLIISCRHLQVLNVRFCTNVRNRNLDSSYPTREGVELAILYGGYVDLPRTVSIN